MRSCLSRAARVLFLVAACVASARDASSAVVWQQIQPNGATPSPRRDAAMAYDRARHRLVLFGGRQAATPLDDTWIFDLDTGVWRQAASGAAARPSPRFSMVSGIDAVGGRFVITSGQGQSGFFNDAWAFDLVAETWTQLPSSGAVPSVRYGSGGGIEDLGGFTAPGTRLFLSHGFTDMGRFDDSRALDPATGGWVDLTPAGVRPLKRCLHGSSVVSPKSFVLFGGCASGFGPCPLDDTWLFDADAGQWTDLSQVVRPPARMFPSLVTLGSDGDLLLFGGVGGPLYNDVWRLTRGTWSWAALSPGGVAPSARQGSSMVWVDSPDPALTGAGCGRAIVFGGRDAATDRNDLWSLSPTVSPAPAVVQVEKSDGNALFSWAADPAVSGYEVWRDDHPEFQPRELGPVRLPGAVTSTGGTASYLDDTSGIPQSIFYYRVRLGRCEGF